MPDKVYLGVNVATLEKSPSFSPYSKVVLWVDDENGFVSGDDTGRTLEATLPWATQQIADDILASIRGFIYHPFSATDALINPAAELGDGVTVSDSYAPLASMETTFDSLYSAHVAAPADEEVDHEFPHFSSSERELRRKVSLGKSYYGTRITRANGLEVVKTEADGTEKSRVKLNSDVLAFYNDDGEEALYFDAAAGRYRFRGDVEVTGGSMNINGKFVVDEDGNLTLKGNINLSEGKITWGQNYPGGGGLTEDEVEEIASTVITSELVAAPTIKAAKFYGGEFIGSFKGEEFTVDSEDSSGSFNLYGKFQNDKYHFFEISYYEGEGPYIHIDSPGGGFMYLGGNASALRVESAIYFNGVVDFSNATVTGLDIVFG